MILTDTFPSLAECLERGGTTPREAKQLVRALLGAAQQFVESGEPAPDDLIADLRCAIGRDDIGFGLVRAAARQLWNLQPDEKRN